MFECKRRAPAIAVYLFASVMHHGHASANAVCSFSGAATPRMPHAPVDGLHPRLARRYHTHVNAVCSFSSAPTPTNALERVCFLISGACMQERVSASVPHGAIITTLGILRCVSIDDSQPISSSIWQGGSVELERQKSVLEP